MARKQNIFADMEDAMDDHDTLYGIAILANLIALICIWIASGSFWVAVVLTFLGTWCFSGAAICLAAFLSTMFARRKKDDEDTGHPRLTRFIFSLPLAFMSVLFLSVIFLAFS
ncbi:MAG: hypothetical protein LBM17_06940 [Candidatus Accumulibacter sp.]|jgi:hypothetical protein|nr:hypothetical protein [Accumulibacter sp.]